MRIPVSFEDDPPIVQEYKRQCLVWLDIAQFYFFWPREKGFFFFNVRENKKNKEEMPNQ